MADAFLREYKYLLMMIFSIVLGFFIGQERKTRAKEAIKKMRKILWTIKA